MLSGIWAWLIMTYLVSKLTLYFFSQNHLQAKIINNYNDHDNLKFADIIILGMDKEPTNFTGLFNNVVTSISNVSYSASTKVGDCSILPSRRALAQSPGLKFWRPTLLCFFEFGQSQRQPACREIYHIVGRVQKEKLCMLNTDPCTLFQWTPKENTSFSGTLKEGSSSLGKFKTGQADPGCDVVQYIIQTMLFNTLA